MGDWKTVKVERDENGVAWVTLNRPEKKNAMNPTMHQEMLEILDQLQFDPETKILVLTGAGESWCAGQDLKESFQDLWGNPYESYKLGWRSSEWRWRRLNYFPKPTIAMVNGWCFGGGFTQLIACDFAYAAEEAVFGLSEINWGSFPGGLVARVIAEKMNNRDALYYSMTGDTFTGRQAVEIGLVNAAFPLDELRDRTVELCEKLLEKNQAALSVCKITYKHVKELPIEHAEDYLWAKLDTLEKLSPGGAGKGIKQFVDGRYKAGLTHYDQNA